jgi:transposase
MEDVMCLDQGVVDGEFVERFLAAQVTEVESRRFALQSAEVIAFTLLTIQARLSVSQTQAGPHTPSATIPPYEKPAPSSKPRNRRKRGGQTGHAGRARNRPLQPDRTRTHRLRNCPQCGTKLRPTSETRERFSEDIPEDLKPVVTKDVIHRDYCPCCRKRVEPKVPDVLPNCTLGNRTLVFSALLHFLQGLTLSQIVDTFNFHLRLKITPGGLIQMWHRLADILFAWYEQIHQESLESSTLHADETGWRVAGQTHWLWCFASDRTVFYMIDRSRGSPALQKFFTEYFDGTLITDFWSPYDAIDCADQQKCWPHLLRDVAAVDEKFPDDQEWSSFCRRLISVYRAAKKLHAQKATLPADDYELQSLRLEGRLVNLGVEDWTHPDAKRLSKRLKKYHSQLLTFLRTDEMTSDNNAGERAIRPAVMIRKNSYANQSDRGALTQSVLMTIFRTLKLRGCQPIDTLLEALRIYNQTNNLPPLPKTASEH